MTFHITFGVDPGLSGAIAVLADGEYDSVIDMPTAGRGKAGRQNVNAAHLAEHVREVLAAHPGASVLAVVEQVGAMPGQGVSSMFRFGQSYGAVLGVLAALRVPLLQVTPQAWKRGFGLLGADKDSSRGIAIERFPTAPLARKRDHGRADALLLAKHGYSAEQGGLKESAPLHG